MLKNLQTKILSVATALLIIATASAQPAPAQNDDNLPTDYLTKEFHAGRRDALRQIMPDNSVMVVFAFPTRTFSNDVEYFYHQNPDLYYFSGYKEPHSLLLVFKEPQTDSLGNKYSELLFVQKRNAQAEQWTGKRLGTEGVKEKLGINNVFNGADFKKYSIDFSKFTKIICDKFPVDVPNGYDNADLYDLIAQFKLKAGVPEQMTRQNKFDSKLYHDLTATLRQINPARRVATVRVVVAGPEVAELIEDQFLRIAQACSEDFQIRAVGIAAIDDAGLAVLDDFALLVFDVGAAITDAEVDSSFGTESQAMQVVSDKGHTNSITVMEHLRVIGNAVTIGIADCPQIRNTRVVNGSVVFENPRSGTVQQVMKSAGQNRVEINPAVAVRILQHA